MKTNLSIRLTPEEETKLLAIARKTKSLSRHGKTSGQPSWRILVQDIAAGRVGVKGGGK